MSPRPRYADRIYPRHTSRSSCAVRYAHLTGCGLGEAARTFGLCLASVREQWWRIYPSVPAAIDARRAMGRGAA